MKNIRTLEHRVMRSFWGAVLLLALLALCIQVHVTRADAIVLDANGNPILRIPFPGPDIYVRMTATPTPRATPRPATPVPYYPNIYPPQKPTTYVWGGLG